MDSDEYRLPTVLITHDDGSTDELARCLGEQGIFVWNGHYYAIQITESLGLEPGFSREALDAAMEGHVLASASITGSYATNPDLE